VAINNGGQVVGYFSMSNDADHRIFITGPDGDGMRELFDDSESINFVRDINDAGQVVGDFRIFPDVSHAFITSPNGMEMMDLNSLVDLPAGVILTNAVGINNLRQVIALGVIPEPEAYAMFLAGLGLIGFIARRKHLLA
jgi:probable HAF family extracellular repeat protein